jgi:glutamate-5-semialdehyde dehydrogenase
MKLGVGIAVAIAFAPARGPSRNPHPREYIHGLLSAAVGATSAFFCGGRRCTHHTGDTMDIRSAARHAGAAALRLAAVPARVKNRALTAIAEELLAGASRIRDANREDLERSAREGLAPPLLKRLRFDDAKLDEAVTGIRSLVGLPDPVGRTLSATELDAGLELYRVTCPIGVIGVIFESRPDALVQISCLCLKSGNAVLLKGGSEAAATNRVLGDIIARAAVTAGIPDGWLHLAETRADVSEMLTLDDAIDLLIPRGSNAFVRHIMDHSNIPVLGHADGVCHVYVDARADLAMAAAVASDAKCQYAAVCNAAECLLVHRDVAPDFLPMLVARLAPHRVEIRGCPQTAAIIPCTPAGDDAWGHEYLDYVLAVRVVDSLDAAIDHINTYGSGHTDAIVTADRAAASRFMELVDSGNVFWNCSTRFSDGYRYGLGAEVGIGTGKIHARGPVGLDGLVIYKWKLKGAGHVVADYADGRRTFTHRRLRRRFHV